VGVETRLAVQGRLGVGLEVGRRAAEDGVNRCCLHTLTHDQKQLLLCLTRKVGSSLVKRLSALEKLADWSLQQGKPSRMGCLGVAAHPSSVHVGRCATASMHALQGNAHTLPGSRQASWLLLLLPPEALAGPWAPRPGSSQARARRWRSWPGCRVDAHVQNVSKNRRPGYAQKGSQMHSNAHTHISLARKGLPLLPASPALPHVVLASQKVSPLEHSTPNMHTRSRAAAPVMSSS